MNKISRRKFIKLLATTGATLSLPEFIWASRSKIKQPNILVICSDEHHPRMTGYRGHAYVKTPHLDQLAAEGTYFSRAYCASPVCTPSRACFLTGKYVHQNNTWMIGVPTDPNEMTWPRRLTQASFDTAAYGKMDLSGKYQNPGFSEFFQYVKRPSFDPYPLNTPYPPRMAGYVRSDKRRHIERAGISEDGFKELARKYGSKDFLFRYDNRGLIGYHAHDREVTELGIAFLRQKKREKFLRQQNNEKIDRPWVLYLGYIQPHWPFKVPKQYFDMYYPDNLSWPHDAFFPNEKLHPALKNFQQALNISGLPEDAYRHAIAAYYGMITCLDDLIGKIIHELKTHNFYDDTYIIYTSDHGDSLGEHGLFYKQCSYEGSVGVPLIVKGPGVPAGQHIDHPVSLVDEYPTIMEMANLISETDRPGHSWLPLLRGENSDYPDYVFSEYHGNFIRPSWYMIVHGEYKYTYYSNGLRPSLFNIGRDPMENFNLGGNPKYNKVLKEFEERLQSIINPEETALRSKTDLGLIGPDGEDYTETLSWQELQQGIQSGKFPELKFGYNF